MATQPSSSEALKKLEDQLTCPICLDHLTDPKTLPCLHSFCQHCLQGVPLDLVQSDKYLLTCPTCRSSSELPQTGVAGLPTAFLINNLSEVYGLLKKVSTTRDVSCENCENKTNATGYCKKCGLFYCQECLHHHKQLKLTADHEIMSLDEVADAAYQLPAVRFEVGMKCSSHEKPLDIYCETCEELVCQHCTVRIHKDHDYDVVSDAYQKHRQALEAGAIQPLKEQVVRISEALAVLIQRRNDITQQGEEVKEDIHATIQHVIEQLHKMEGQLTEEVEEALKAKVGVVNMQVKSTESALGQLTQCLDFVEQGLKVGTPQQILSAKAQMKNRSESIVSFVEKEKFEPVEQADIKLKKSEKISDIPNNIGSLRYSLSQIKVSVLKDRLPLVGRESTCTISLSSSNDTPVPVPSSLISCYLTPPDDQQNIECSVKESRQPGEYEVTFTPITRSLHQLYVRVGGSNIPSSPVSIPVSVPPENRGTPVNIITGLEGPYGVAVTEESQVVISEYSASRVTILNKEGKKIRSFGSSGTGRGQFDSPTGIAVAANGIVLVADCFNNRIQQFTMEGECISSVGSNGTGSLQFNKPRGIAVNKLTGQVFVADSGNHRIQVLNPNLSFSHMFGNNGSKEGQFNDPWDLTVDDTGTVFVADTYNHRIQQFTPEGRLVSMFNTNSEYPIGIVSRDGILYVSQQGNNFLSMYTTSGKYLSSIGGEDDTTLQLKTPQHITIDTEGYLYLCDYYNSRVLIL